MSLYRVRQHDTTMIQMLLSLPWTHGATTFAFFMHLYSTLIKYFLTFGFYLKLNADSSICKYAWHNSHIQPVEVYLSILLTFYAMQLTYFPQAWGWEGSLTALSNVCIVHVIVANYLQIMSECKLSLTWAAELLA